MNNVLYHHGILGQKWGVRNYQYPDGSLTEEGKRRYYKAYSNQERQHLSKNRTIGQMFENEKLDPTPITNVKGKLNLQREKIKNIEIEYDNLFKNYLTKTHKKYMAISAVANSLLEAKEKGREMNHVQMGSIAKNILLENANDGKYRTNPKSVNPKTIYLKDTNQLGKAKKIAKKYEQAKKEYQKACASEIKNVLGKYGNKRLSLFSPKTVSKSMIEKFIKEDTTKSKDIYYSTKYPDNFTTSKAIKFAKQINSKLGIDSKDPKKFAKAIEATVSGATWDIMAGIRFESLNNYYKGNKW